MKIFLTGDNKDYGSMFMKTCDLSTKTNKLDLGEDFNDHSRMNLEQMTFRHRDVVWKKMEDTSKKAVAQSTSFDGNLLQK